MFILPYLKQNLVQILIQYSKLTFLVIHLRNQTEIHIDEETKVEAWRIWNNLKIATVDDDKKKL